MSKQPPSPERWLQVVIGWHGLAAATAFITSLLLLTGLGPAADLALWVRIVGGILLLVGSGASGAAAYYITQRNHRGRTLSLFFNYLAFVTFFLGVCQATGVFLGIDNLADTIGRGLPFLLIVFVGYLVGTVADRFEGNYVRQQQINRVSQGIMVVAGLAAALAVGLLPGTLYLLKQLANPIALALVAGAIITGLMLWLMWREKAATALHAQTHHEAMLNGYLFLSPNLLGFLIFFAGPLLLSLYVSFTDWDAFGTRNWVGLDNYAEILNLTVDTLDSPDQRADEVLDITTYSELTRLTVGGRTFIIGAEDRLFWLSLRNTFVFAILAVPLSVGIALLLSNLLNTKLPGIKFFRAVYFLPSIAAVVGISLVWQWLYNSTIGFINYGILSLVTFVNNIFGWELADPAIRWLSESRTALLAIIIMAVWQTVGFNTVLFLAGLQNIPGDLYEAATVDGAGKWAQFRNVTIPMLAPTTFFVVTTTLIKSLQVFEEIFILTNPVGGPDNSTLTLVVYLYQNGFQYFKQGYASAIAWVLFIVIFGATLWQFRRQRQTVSGVYDV
ncbi:MAG: sugar ABC transporter permease [Chloroflexi bacterium]|nr:sugar ABC transporter permease [Chloroflexota bacterium]MBP8056300.1 sugar ABC transporter permease [Chloroflexota bacterium]